MKAKLQLMEDWLHKPLHESAGFVFRIVHRALRILYALIREFLKGDISLHAMSLVYTTILSIVPLLALSFSVLKAFDVQDRFTPMLYGFFEPMGEKGLEIHNQVLSFIDNMKVGVLGLLGFLLLFYTVVSLIQKIERAFNTIWFAPSLRSLSQRFTNYLSIVLVGPVVMVGAIGMTASTLNSGVMQTLMAIEPFGTLILTLSKLVPFIMVIAAFTFFYLLMPNTKVNFSSALVGGVVGGATWQAMSLLFTSFVVSSAKYDAIYSGFAVGIILLIWLYVNWLILLVGSSIAFFFQNDSHITRRTELDIAPETTELLALDIMLKVSEEYDDASDPVCLNDLETSYTLPAVLTRRIIDQLINHDLLLVVGDAQDKLAPGHSTDKISVSDVLNAVRCDTNDYLTQTNLHSASLSFLQSNMEQVEVERRKTSLRSLIESNKK